eukprot:scaffold283242_cov23-Tisochrysis_lutea.AAC.1
MTASWPQLVKFGCMMTADSSHLITSNHECMISSVSLYCCSFCIGGHVSVSISYAVLAHQHRTWWRPEDLLCSFKLQLAGLK